MNVLGKRVAGFQFSCASQYQSTLSRQFCNTELNLSFCPTVLQPGFSFRFPDTQNYRNCWRNGLAVPPLPVPLSKYQHPNSSLSFPAPRSAIQCGTKASNERFKTTATTIKALKEVNTESVRLCHILPVTTKRTLCPQIKTEEQCPSGL